MHEWFINRGHVRGAPFEWQMQIYVPWNVVILHEGSCHIKAQRGEEGMLTCLNYTVRYYHYPVILDWLRAISPVLTVAREMEQWLLSVIAS